MTFQAKSVNGLGGGASGQVLEALGEPGRRAAWRVIDFCLGDGSGTCLAAYLQVCHRAFAALLVLANRRWFSHVVYSPTHGIEWLSSLAGSSEEHKDLNPVLYFPREFVSELGHS